jgi:ATP-dependent DNA helicase PIF1
MINEAVMSRFPSSPSFSVATDDLRECKYPDEYPEEYVSSLIIHGVPPYSLTLQTNARYMIIRNAAPPGMCNGTQAVLLSHSRFMCKLRLLTGPGKGKIVYLPRFSFRVTSDNSGLPFTFTRRQFPIIPSYCVSVHKSQGQSLDYIGLVAEKDAFAHGQVYVGMSRVGSWGQIAFYSPRGENFLQNRVSKELIAKQMLS